MSNTIRHNLFAIIVLVCQCESIGGANMLYNMYCLCKMTQKTALKSCTRENKGVTLSR